MQRDRSSTQHWSLQGTTAQLTCGSLLAELDVQRPMQGLRNLRLPGEAVEGWLMAVEVRDAAEPSEKPWQPIEVYTRGGDLVATYREPMGQPFHLQIYWRAASAKRYLTGALEAIVSIQTREWEAYPSIALSSALKAPAAELHDGGVRFLSRHDWSYVELSPLGDFEPSVHELTTGLSQAHWSYEKRFMERGVIRRLRLRGAFVPSADAEEAIEQIRADFASEPPPLTA